MTARHRAVPPGGGDATARLLKSSLLLLMSTVTMAGLGFAFWVVVGRLFSTREVGLGTSLISAANLIGYLSLLGLNGTLIRFMDAWRDRDVPISQAVAAVFGCGALLSLGYVLLMPTLIPNLSFVRRDWVAAALFVLLSALGALNLLTDAVFIGARRPGINVLIDGFVQGLSKLAAPALLVSAGALGVFYSVGSGYLVATAVSLLTMRRALGWRPRLGRRWALDAHETRYSLGSYVSNCLSIAPAMVLPIIVLGTRGPEEAAYYFIAFQIATLLNAVSFAVGEAIFSEGSAQDVALGGLLRRSALLLPAAQVPAIMVVIIASPWALGLFGGQYRARAESLLVVFSVGALGVALNTWGSFVLKITKQMVSLTLSNVVFVIATLGLALWWTHWGLVWTGVAWGVGNAVAGLVAIGAFLRTRRRTVAEPIERADLAGMTEVPDGEHWVSSA